MKRLYLLFLVIFFCGCSGRSGPLWVFHLNKPVKSAALLEEGQKLAVLTSDEILVLDVKTGMEIKRIKIKGDFKSIDCADLVCWIGGGSHEKGKLEIVDTGTGQILKISKSFAEVNAILLDPKHEPITAHSDETVIAWNGKNIEPKNQMIFKDGLEVYALVFSKNYFLVGNAKGQIGFWDGKSISPEKIINLQEGAVLAIVAADDQVLAGGWGGINVLDVNSGKKHSVIEFNNAAVTSCDSSNALKVVVCGLSNGSVVKVIGTKDYKVLHNIHKEKVVSVNLVNDILITAGGEGAVKAWALSQVGNR